MNAQREIFQKSIESERAKVNQRINEAVVAGDIDMVNSLRNYDAKLQSEHNNASYQPQEDAQQLPNEINQAGKEAESMYAEAIASRIKRENNDMPLSQITALVDREMSVKFPELYPSNNSIRRATPVETVQRRATVRKKGKTGADLPAEAKQAAQQFIKEGLIKDLDEYAKDYFAD